MLKFIIFYSLSFSFLSYAGTPSELERINFFPKADAYLDLGYRYEIFHIETPQNTLMTKEVTNYSNILSLTYAHRFSRKMFLGMTGFFEQSSENAVKYGVPIRRRFTSMGWREPELFLKYRLRSQKDKKGLVDFNLNISPSLGEREIGKKDSNRLNGRNIMKAALSHGMLEEEWEFQSALEYIYFGEGEEYNGFNQNNYDLDSYSQFNFRFRAQYRLSNWRYFYGSASVIYTTTQDIKERGGEFREIQAGTGSLFEFGIKQILGDWSLLELSYAINRNEYFVKSSAENLEGDATLQSVDLRYKMAF